jgi:predicted dehydrogenase
MVGCNMRFHPGPATVKRLLDERAIGEAVAARIETGSFLPRWRPWQNYRESYSASPQSGGAILDCIHEIDLALWYFGSARVLAAAHLPAGVIGLQTDGLAEILLAHDSGTLSSVHLNFVQRDYRRCCHIIGSEGTLYWNFTERRVTVFDSEGNLARTYEEPAGWDVNTMYMDELTHFLSAVSCGTESMNPLEGGISALRIALTAREVGGLLH